jgi:Uma2 family endonuclease
MVSEAGNGMTSARQSDANGALITGEELSRMPDHELCELIDGRIVQMSPTNPEHGRIEANIARLIGGFASTKNLGIVMTGEVGIFTRRNPDRVRGADVVFVSHETYRRRNKDRGFLDVAPELVVEILSPENAHIDMRQKVEEYLKIGVTLVCVVDPDAHVITAHSRSGAVDRHSVEDMVPCHEVLPGFGLPVAAVFE